MEVHMKAMIHVEHKMADGWFVFTSPEIAGLYVASCDADEALADVPNAIEKLLELDYGVRCTAKPVPTFEEFLREVVDEARAHPRVMQSQQFEITRLAA